MTPCRAVVLAGSAHPALGRAVARALGLRAVRCAVERFPDGELHVDVCGVEVCDVVVVQPTFRGAGEHLLELSLVADAARRAGATSVSAVVPYFGYARHDRRTTPGEALGVRVVSEILGAARLARVIVVDPHSDAVEASLDVPLERLTAVPLLAAAVGEDAARGAVVVAPDLGAVRLAREYARRLRAPLAVVHKVRRSGEEVEVERLAGDVRGLRPILVDDMIATGGTLVAAARALAQEGAAPGGLVAATHAVLAPGAMDRLRAAGLHRLIVTDTVPLAAPTPEVRVVPTAELLAACLRRVIPGLRPSAPTLHDERT